MNRTYTHPKLEIGDYDSLEFYVKFSHIDIKWFGIKVYDLPKHDQTFWRLDNKFKIVANKWIKFKVDLTKPDGKSGGASAREIIVFRYQGTGKGVKSLQIRLDDLVLKKSGRPEQAQITGLQLETWGLGSGPNRWIAANGLNNPPTTKHPMLFLRRTSGHVHYHSILQPMTGTIPIRTSQRTSTGIYKIPYGVKGIDTVQFNQKTGKSTWLRRDDKAQVRVIGFLQSSGLYQKDIVDIQSQKGDLILEVTSRNKLRYISRDLGSWKMRWPWPIGSIQVHVDQKVWKKTRIEIYQGKRWVTLSQLPNGLHTIHLFAGPAQENKTEKNTTSKRKSIRAAQ